MRVEPLSRVLIVAPDADELDDTVKVLGRFQCDLDIINDGRAAWIFFFDPVMRPAILPDLIFLDLRLSNYDGLDLLRQLRSEPLTRNIPVIILTNSALEQHVLENFNLGLHTSIVKPLTYAKLVYALPAIDLALREGVLFSKTERCAG